MNFKNWPDTFSFTVCINNVEVRTVKPGTYKHTITGLTPNTVYKVTVRAKNIKASPFVDEKSLVRLLEKLSAHTEFRTLNKGKLYVVIITDKYFYQYLYYVVHTVS